MPHTGDLLAELLLRYGVTHVFGVPGGQTAALYDGVSRRFPDIRHVLVRDERSGAYAADAYARLTGRPGVCDATVGPGTTKLVDGLVEALNASVPLVAIVGDLPRGWEPLRDRGVGSQGFDQVSMLRTMTKATWPVPDQQTLAQLVRAAFRTATSGRPGPVALVVPHDVFDADWEPDEPELAVDGRHAVAPAQRPGASRASMRQATELLERAERPLIIAGGGVHGSRAYDELAALAGRLDAAVATSFTGKGAVAETAPYAVGVVNPLGSQAAAALAARADAVFWIGCKVGQNTSLNWTLPQSGQATVQLDLDATELGRTFRPDAALAGDAAETLATLLETLPEQRHPDWRAEIAATLDESERVADADPDETPIQPARVMAELARQLGRDDVVVSDASFAAGWVATYLPAQTAGRRFLFARGLGGLGYAVPAAIGAACVTPAARVVTVSGDGAISYALGELASHAQHGLKTTHVVLNNGTLGWLRVWQHLFFEKLNQSVELESERVHPSLAGVTTALGGTGIAVSAPGELEPALRRALTADGPALVDVRCAEWATPVHGYRRRLDEGGSYPRPGTVYEARPWVR